MRRLLAVPLGLGVAGAAGLAYGVGVERTAYRLRRCEVPVLPAGCPRLRVLLVSDLHLTPGQTGKSEWLRELARLSPDLVVSAGDHLGGTGAVPAVLRALEPLLAFPGVFVPGNNDYYAPVPKNPLRYLAPDHEHRHGDRLPWPDLAGALSDAGWVDLTNRRTTLSVAGRRVEVAGVDDPFLRRDRYAGIGGPVGADVDLPLAVAHVPEPRVLDRFVADGFRLLLCGHTHGGQVRIPGYGAIVTNCGIDRARARWLSRYDLPPGSARAADAAPAWLYVSAGVGTSPYAPVRFACPPEATLLTLVAAAPDDSDSR